MNNKITIEAIVENTMDKVWMAWNDPEHIMKWAFASDDWEVPEATNDLKVGGRFMTRMAAKDKSAGFDFAGTYTEVVPNQKIAYTMDGDDARTAVTLFEVFGEKQVKITTTFEMENENPEEMQQGGWQGILNNFKKHAETL